MRASCAPAYRMLGSRTEAEDIVQETWLCRANVDETTVRHAGVWLPEPLLDVGGRCPPCENHESRNMAFRDRFWLSCFPLRLGVYALSFSIFRALRK